MKKITKQHSASKMMDELSQLKIYGGREESAEKFKLSMKNCKTVCLSSTKEE